MHIHNFLFRYKFQIVVLLILLVGIIPRFYWMSQKEGMFVDEVLSFLLCQYNDYGWGKMIVGEYTGQQIKTLTMGGDPTFSGVLADLRDMHRTVRDPQHTNFYYSLLRIATIGCSDNIQVINFRAFLLNLVIFIIEFFFMLKLLMLYWGDKRHIALIGLACFSIAVGCISNTLFFRPYQLQECTYVILAFWVAKLIMKIRKNETIVSVKNFVFTSLCVFLVLYTGYFTMFYVAALGVLLLFELYKKKCLANSILYLFLSLFVALCICRVMYGPYFYGFQGDSRVSEQIFGNGLGEKIIYSVRMLFILLKDNVLYLPVAIIISLFFLIKRNIKCIPVILLPVFLYSALVMCIAPYKVSRYISAVFPLMILLIPSCLSIITIKRLKTFITLMVVMIYSTMPLFESHIDHLEVDNFTKRILSNASGNIYILQSNQPWELGYLIPYMDDSKSYILSKKNEDVTFSKGDVLIISNSGPISLPNNSKLLGEKNIFSIYSIL